MTRSTAPAVIPAKPRVVCRPVRWGGMARGERRPGLRRLEVIDARGQRQDAEHHQNNHWEPGRSADKQHLAM